MMSMEKETSPWRQKTMLCPTAQTELETESQQSGRKVANPAAGLMAVGENQTKRKRSDKWLKAAARASFLRSPHLQDNVQWSNSSPSNTTSMAGVWIWVQKHFPTLQSVTNVCELPFQAEVFRVAENQSSCCSLKTNRTMKLEFEVGEVPEGAAW